MNFKSAFNIAIQPFTKLTATFRQGFSLLVFFLLSSSVSIIAQAVDFEQDIKPIFESHCIECHQPNIMKGNFSLATAKDLKTSGHIEPDHPDKSLLLKVISMGPMGEKPEMPEKGAPLNTAQRTMLTEWVMAGTPWPDDIIINELSKADESWWSLQSLAAIQPPSVETLPAGWQKNPIDRFIGAKLAEHNLTPSPTANRRTLIRRLYFDLIGLPPTFEAVQAFENDMRPNAYEQLVDELLESPHYGERWARHWLDVAHYADTHGFERDQRRDNAYHYRDYVIRAFNEDKPYDMFLSEQIAGDVMSPESRDAVIATGFLAAGPWDFVGQVETKSPVLKRAARADDLDDIVTTVISSTMGLTVNCARCHDHKLDPILQKDYYRLTAVFSGTTRGDRAIDPTHVAAKERFTAIEKELRLLQQHSSIDLADVIAGGNGIGTGSKYPSGINVKTGKLVDSMVNYVEGATLNQYTLVNDSPYIDGVFVPSGTEGTPLKITSSGIAVKSLPPTSGKTWDHILNGPVSSQDSTILNSIDFNKEPHRLIGLHANKGITFDLDTLGTEHQGTRFQFSTIVGYGGGNDQSKADYFIYVDGKLRASQRGFGKSEDGNIVRFGIEDSERFLTLVATDGGDGIGHDQVFFGDPILTIEGARTSIAPEQQELKIQLEAEKIKLEHLYPPTKNIEQVYATVAQAPPVTHVQLRGDPETPGAQVNPGVLTCFDESSTDFGSDKLDEGERRVALAQWIANPKNPLTSRVWVNRLWHYHFGTGIVDTPSDFGYGGGRPTHPELLDWLASKLVEQKWSTKAMHRLLLTSQTYRQESQINPAYDLSRYADPRTIDIDNRLLWRMTPRRIEAEILRDTVLAVSGKLNPTAFGPGYRDFNYEEEYAPKYTYITADTPDHWRRSIYRFVVRSTPQPFMTTLDCPDPAVLSPKRLTTTTALQSLSLLNNDFMLKQSQYFSDRIKHEAGEEISAQVGLAFRIVYGREPNPDEREHCETLALTHGLPSLCRVLFNTNEFVHID